MNLHQRVFDIPLPFLTDCFKEGSIENRIRKNPSNFDDEIMLQKASFRKEKNKSCKRIQRRLLKKVVSCCNKKNMIIKNNIF